MSLVVSFHLQFGNQDFGSCAEARGKVLQYITVSSDMMGSSDIVFSISQLHFDQFQTSTKAAHGHT